MRLDAATVESLDQTSAYHVFLTPEGDTNGLYVSQKTQSYFVVRETHGGRGSFAFDYRIVGSVDGQAQDRMKLTNKRRMEDGQPALAVRPTQKRYERATTPTIIRPRSIAANVGPRVHALVSNR